MRCLTVQCAVTTVTHSFIYFVAQVTPGGTLRIVRNAAFSAKGREGGRSLAVQLLVLQALLLAAVIAPSPAIAVREAQRAVRYNAEVRATAIIETLADSPLVIDAVTGPDP